LVELAGKSTADDADTIDVELVAAGGGVFEVSRDGDLLFSKKALNRFPEDKEIAAMVPTQ